MLGIAALINGCTTPSNEPPIFISHTMEGDLNRYFTLIGSVNSGAFAISPDGRHAFYSYCTDSSCGSISLSQDALQNCKRMAGTSCVILANGRNVVHPYKVRDGSS
jgi:hypothetical protein